MIELLAFLGGFLVGGCYVAYRLKDKRTWRETGAVILGGGGHSEE